MSEADIDKYIREPQAAQQDPEGHLFGLPPWDEGKAREYAGELGLELTEEHWAVVHYLRERFAREGQAHSGTLLLRELERRFSDGGGRHLFQLFPGGPVTQGSRIAGLPLPAYSSDPHFGSTE